MQGGGGGPAIWTGWDLPYGMVGMLKHYLTTKRNTVSLKSSDRPILRPE